MVVKKAQNILYISLSHSWGSKERAILRDGVILKKNGKNPFLYCYKDSLIAREAANEEIALIHPGKIFSGLFKWRMFFALPGIVRQFNIDLIHFYQIEFVWPLCFFLYRFIEIPLVLTQFSEINKFYTSIFYRTLIYRVDMFICPFVGLKQNLVSHLMVRSRKIFYCGMAPLFSNVLDNSKNISVKKKNDFCIGVAFNGDKDEEHHIRTLFQALAVFNKKMDQSVYLELISKNSWEENTLYRFYREISWEHQVGDWISFEKNDALFENPSHFDLWLELPHGEDLEDCSLWAVLGGTPILVPRTASSMDIFESYGRVGECYKSSDGREFWQKGLRILQNIDFYRGELKKVAMEVRKSCDVSKYGKQVLELYDGLRTRRWAYKGKISRSSRS